jgi:hypothetical protein
VSAQTAHHEATKTTPHAEELGRNTFVNFVISTTS